MGYDPDRDVLFSELVADVVGHHFMDKQFWKDVADAMEGRKFKRLVNRVLRFLKRTVFKAKLHAPDTYKYFSDMMAFRDTLANVVAEYAKRNRQGEYEGRVPETQRSQFARAKDLDQAPASVSDEVEARLKDAKGIKRKPWAERAKDLTTKTKHDHIFRALAVQGY